MTCPNCDQTVEASAAYCGNCGFHLQATPTPSVTPESPAPAPSTLPAPVTTASSVPERPAAASETPALPAYAVPQPTDPETKKATLPLVLAILSIPGALIPIIGFALCIPALVMTSKHRKSSRAASAFTIAIIGLALSVLAFGYNIYDYSTNREASLAPAVWTATVGTGRGSLDSIVQPVFSTQ